MRRFSFFLFLSVALLSQACTGEPSPRVVSLNDGWSFVRDSLVEAENVRFDASAWKQVDLPHDFSLEPLPEGENTMGSFSRETKGGRSVGYLSGGTGWYRKTFALSRPMPGRR